MTFPRVLAPILILVAVIICGCGKDQHPSVFTTQVLVVAATETITPTKTPASTLEPTIFSTKVAEPVLPTATLIPTNTPNPIVVEPVLPTATLVPTSTPNPMEDFGAFKVMISTMSEEEVKGWMMLHGSHERTINEEYGTYLILPGECSVQYAEDLRWDEEQDKNGTVEKIGKLSIVCATTGQFLFEVTSPHYSLFFLLDLDNPQLAVAIHDTNGAYVIIDEIITPLNGWVVISTLQPTMEIIGRRSVEKGRTSSLEILFVSHVLEPCNEVIAMIHADFGEKGVFEYPGPDVPLMEKGQSFYITNGTCSPE